MKNISDDDLKRFPVEYVSWDEVQQFLTKLNQRAKEEGWVYRLPTEAEWEYACRGGPLADRADSAFDFYFEKPTNQLLPEQANFQATGLMRTCMVGSYEPNALGLYDMHGNVAEWCHDAITFANGSRWDRGGAWGDPPPLATAAYHYAHPSSAQGPGIGLRLARIPIAAAAQNSWLDLLPLVDPKADAIAGKWRFDSKTLVCDGADVLFSRLALPVRPVGDYQLVVEFTRQGGINGPSLNLPVGPRQVHLAMDCGNVRFTALELVDGHAVDDPANPTNNRSVRIADNVRYSVEVRVSTKGDNATIQADLDGKRILDWTGKQELLSVSTDWSLGDNNRLGLHPWGLDIRYESVKLRMLSGEAKLLRQPKAPEWPAVLHVAEDSIPNSPPRLDDWPMHGGDAGNTFYNRNEKTLAPPLAKVWECTLPGSLDSVVVSSGTVLTTGMESKSQKNHVFAVDALNGRQLWTFPLPGGGGGAMSLAPACSDDLAFFGGQNDENVYAVNLRTGQLRWQQGDIKSMYGSSPKVADGLLYVNSLQSGLWVFDAQTGKLKWHEKDVGRQSDIAAKAGRLLRPAGAYGGALVAFDAATGQQLWHTDGSTAYSVTASDELVFVTYAGERPVEITEDKDFKRYKYDRIAAFELKGGKKVWETTLKEDAYYGRLLLAADSLYAATREGSIYCLDSRTGKIRTERPFKGTGGLIAAGNLIFASSRDGTCALAPNTLETLWETSASGELAVANGRLYIVSGSRIVAFANAP